MNTMGIVLPPPQDPNTCYEHPKHVIQIVIGLAIVFGQFIGFGPQIANICIKKHTEGISILTYMLGTISCTAALFAGFIKAWPQYFCCKSPWHCIVSLIPFAQLAVNWWNYFVIFILLAVYVKNSQQKPKAKLAFRLSLTLYVMWGLLGGFAVTLTLLLVSGGLESTPTSTYDKILGVVGTTTIVLQWSPQIVTTIVHKGPGALSIITLCINSPGALITFASQLMSKSSWSVWFPYLLSGLQQAVLIALIIFFYIQKRRSKGLNKAIDDAIEDIIENDPGFQGPALLVEDGEAKERRATLFDSDDESDGLIRSRNTNGANGNRVLESDLDDDYSSSEIQYRLEPSPAKATAVFPRPGTSVHPTFLESQSGLVREYTREEKKPIKSDSRSEMTSEEAGEEEETDDERPPRTLNINSSGGFAETPKSHHEQ